MSAIFHHAASAKILPCTFQTSWCGWDSQGDCDSLYAGSDSVQLLASRSGNPNTAMQDQLHSEPADEPSQAKCGIDSQWFA